MATVSENLDIFYINTDNTVGTVTQNSQSCNNYFVPDIVGNTTRVVIQAGKN